MVDNREEPEVDAGWLSNVVHRNNIFAMVEELLPSTFRGVRLQGLTRPRRRGSTGWLMSSVDRVLSSIGLPLPADDGPLLPTAMIGVSDDGLQKSTSFWGLVRYDYSQPDRHASFATRLEPASGNWNAYTSGRVHGVRPNGSQWATDASVNAQVAAWNVPATIQFDLDYTYRGKIASVSLNPVLKTSTFQYLQVMNAAIKGHGK